MSFPASAHMDEINEICKILNLEHVVKLQINIESNQIITVDATIEVQEEQLRDIVPVLKTIKFQETE